MVWQPAVLRVVGERCSAAAGCNAEFNLQMEIGGYALGGPTCAPYGAVIDSACGRYRRDPRTRELATPPRRTR